MGTFNSNHVFSRRGNGRKQLGIEKSEMKKTTRKQALKNKICNLLKPTSAIHLIQIFQTLQRSYALENNYTMTEEQNDKEQNDRGRESLNAKIKKLREMSPFPLPYLLEI